MNKFVNKVYNKLYFLILLRTKEVLIKYYKYRNKTIVRFLHIRKTGGTAVKDAFFWKNIYVVGNIVFILENHPVKIFHIPQGEDIFFVVRDPVKRFCSAFYDRYYESYPRYYSPLRKEEMWVFNFFSTPNELAEALSSKDVELKELAEKAMKSLVHVKHFQINWIKNKDYFLSRIEDIYWIGTQENLSNDFEEFKRKSNLMGKINLPKDEKNSHTNPHSKSYNLSKKAQINLKSWYKADYDFLKLLYDKKFIKKKYS